MTLPQRDEPNGPGKSRGRRVVGRLPALLALLLAAGCGGGAPDDLLSPTAVDVALPPTTVADTPTVAPTPTMWPTTTAASMATATALPTPCALSILPAFQPAYLDIELGCPLNAGLDPIATAYAPFEGGQMLWRQDNAVIYVLTNDGRWTQYDDLWREGEAEFTCGQPSNPPTPVRGFGRVWCDQPVVRQGLGAATAAEIGDAGGRAQDFVNGMLLAAPDGSTFVLVGESATWRRVWPND